MADVWRAAEAGDPRVGPRDGGTAAHGGAGDEGGGSGAAVQGGGGGVPPPRNVVHTMLEHQLVQRDAQLRAQGHELDRTRAALEFRQASMPLAVGVRARLDRRMVTVCVCVRCVCSGAQCRWMVGFGAGFGTIQSARYMTNNNYKTYFYSSPKQ